MGSSVEAISGAGWPFLVYGVLVVVIAASIVGIAFVLGQRHRDLTTDERYESGLPQAGPLPKRFSIEFYEIAVFFVVFDLEAVFIFAWAVALRDVGLARLRRSPGLHRAAARRPGLPVAPGGARLGHERATARQTPPGAMMAHLPRFARLAALPVVAAVALAIVLPGVVKAATSSPTPTSAASAAGLAASPAAAPRRPRRPPAIAGAGPGSGAAIYAANCSGCHGDHGQGLIGPSQQADAFPSLVAGMVERGGISMPAFRQFSAAQVAAVSNFVATQIADPAARTATIAEGGRLFRLYCSGCHSSTGRGGALSQGRNAPSLADYPAAEALAAMILGRGNMPNFAGTTFTVRQQASVALYVQLLQAPPSPGGWGLGYIGPVTEGLACFAALGLIVLLTVWLAWGKGQVKPTAPATGDAAAPAVVAAAAEAASDTTPGTAAPIRTDAGPAPAGGRFALTPPGWPAAIGLLVAIAGAVGFVTFFILGNSAQKLGGTMALSFLGLGFALAYWGRDLTSDEVEVGHYPLPPEPAADRSRRLDRRRRLSAAPSTGASRPRPAWHPRRPTPCRPNWATSSPAARTYSPGDAS